MTPEIRRAEIAKIKIGQKALGLDEQTYRAMLIEKTGCQSSKDMSPAQRRVVLDYMASQGAFKSQSKMSRSPVARKIAVLWSDLAKAGKVKDSSTSALRSFIRRQTISKARPEGIADPEWLTATEASRVIEGLKAWLERD